MYKNKWKLFYVLTVILFYGSIASAGDNCNLLLKDTHPPVSMKKYIYDEFQKKRIIYNENDPAILIFSEMLDELNTIFQSEYYSQFTPRNVKRLIEEIGDLIRSLNQNDPDIDNWHRDQEGKILSYYLVEIPLKILNKYNLDRAYDSLKPVLKRELGKFKKRVYRVYKGEKNRRKRENLQERISGLNQIMTAVRNLKNIKKEIGSLKFKRERVLPKLTTTYHYLMQCNYKKNEVNTLYNRIKLDYRQKYQLHKKASRPSQPADERNQVEGDIYAGYITRYRQSHTYHVTKYRFLFNNLRFYILNYLGSTLIPTECYDGRITIHSYALNGLRQVSPVIFARNEKTSLNFNYFNEGRKYTPTYYLPYEDNQSYTMRLGSDASFFITDNLSGCGFQAFGTESSPLVTHANAKGINIGTNTIEKNQGKETAMASMFDQIICNNMGSLRGRWSVVRVFCNVDLNIQQENGGWSFEERYIRGERNGIIYRNKIAVYTLYYPRYATILGKRNGTRWSLSILRAMPREDGKEVVEDVKQIWPVPDQVRAHYRHKNRTHKTNRNF